MEEAGRGTAPTCQPSILLRREAGAVWDAGRGVENKAERAWEGWSGMDGALGERTRVAEE